MACTTLSSLFWMRRPSPPSPCSLPSSIYHSVRQHTFPTQRTLPPLLLSSITNNNNGCYINKISTRLSTQASKFGIECITKEKKDRKGSSNVFDGLVGGEGRVVVDEILKTFLNAFKKLVIAGIVLGALFLSCEALASSGGSMGGGDFSSDSGSYSSSDSGGDFSSDSGSYSSSDSGGDYSTDTSRDGPGKPMSEYEKIILKRFFVILAPSFLVVVVLACMYPLDTRTTTVVMLQVGLLGATMKSLQRELNRIAETTNTSTSEGLSSVLKGTILALLQHPDSCISCYSAVYVKFHMEAAEELFNQLSIEERRKFDEETLVNVNNIKRTSTYIPQANESGKEYMVVTILLAVKGIHEFPVIDSWADVKKALEKLSSIPSSERRAVQVLWTPQKENDSLSESEYLEDYPLLRPLQ